MRRQLQIEAIWGARQNSSGIRTRPPKSILPLDLDRFTNSNPSNHGDCRTNRVHSQRQYNSQYWTPRGFQYIKLKLSFLSLTSAIAICTFARWYLAIINIPTLTRFSSYFHYARHRYSIQASIIALRRRASGPDVSNMMVEGAGILALAAQRP